jgi:hypothetical protein
MIFIMFSLMRRPDAAGAGLLGGGFIARRPEKKPLLSAWESRLVALEFVGRAGV